MKYNSYPLLSDFKNLTLKRSSQNLKQCVSFIKKENRKKKHCKHNFQIEKFKIFFYRNRIKTFYNKQFKDFDLSLINPKKQFFKSCHTLLKNRTYNIFYKLKKYFLIFLSLHFSQTAIGQNVENTIWIQQNQMPLNEFKSNVKTLGFPNISYAEYHLKQARNQTHFFQLKEKLIVAQELYLSGESDKALKAFQQISQLALRSDWNEEERRIILYAFLRQAQMEQKPEQRKALLLSASEFALFQINSLNYPDFHLFPPPLREELKNIQDKANFFFLDWNKIFPHHELLLINGQQFEKNKKIKIPQASYRISVFSSSHSSWSKKINLSELLTQQIKTQSLTRGFCEKTQIKKEYIKINMRLLPFSNCIQPGSLSLKKIKTQSSKTKFLKASLLKNKYAQSIKNQGFSDSFSSTPLELKDLKADMERSELEKEAETSHTTPWLIFGAGTIALILILSLSPEKKVQKGKYVY